VRRAGGYASSQGVTKWDDRAFEFREVRSTVLTVSYARNRYIRYFHLVLSPCPLEVSYGQRYAVISPNADRLLVLYDTVRRYERSTVSRSDADADADADTDADTDAAADAAADTGVLRLAWNLPSNDSAGLCKPRNHNHKPPPTARVSCSRPRFTRFTSLSFPMPEAAIKGSVQLGRFHERFNGLAKTPLLPSRL
jgi:hypothetical protein